MYVRIDEFFCWYKTLKMVFRLVVFLLLLDIAFCGVQVENTIPPLILATQENQTEVVKDLVMRGSDVNVKDSDGLTPLHFASCTGNVELINLLIEKGANVNAVSNAGITPLHLSKSNKILDLLISKGADINLNGGRTFTDAAFDAYSSMSLANAIAGRNWFCGTHSVTIVNVTMIHVNVNFNVTWDTES